jgi:pimeloyl-ACP methyl ester carboxylesterase
MRTVPSTDGVTIAVHDLGGTGPAVVFSHATGLVGAMWTPMARYLADRYHGVAPDYRAHGDSTPPPDLDFDWYAYRADLLAVLDTLDERPVFGVGHSMGGAVLVLAELARPGSLRALALFEPVIVPPGGHNPIGGNFMATTARRRRAEFPSRDAAFQAFASKPPFDHLTPEALRLYVDHGFADTDHGTVRLKCDPEHEARTFEHAVGHDTYAELGDVRCPVLVLAGAGADAPPAQFAAPIAEALPAGTLAVVPGVGHFGPMERPDVVATTVRTFFDQH